jgi:cysteine desulfurase
MRRRPRIRLIPIIDGGGHERGLRSGTLPVPSAVGLGKACEIAAGEMADESRRVAALRDRLWAGIRERLGGVHVNGTMTARVSGNLNVSFEGVDGESLLLALKEVAVSSGAACTSATLEPSYVLRALGVSDALAHASLRFGLGRFTTSEEVETVIALVESAATRLRAIGAG